MISLLIRCTRLLINLTLIFAGLIAFIMPVGQGRPYDPLVYTVSHPGSGDTLRLHDLATGRDVALFNAEHVRIAAVSPHGDVIYTTTRDGVPTMIVRNAHTLQTHLTLTDFDRPAVWSPDGTRLAYVAQDGAGYILHIRHVHAPSATVYPLPAQNSPVNLVWMADGERLTYWEATTPTTYALNRFHVATGTTDVLYEWHARPQNTAWFPDGRYGLFSTVHDTHRFDLTTRQTERLNTLAYDRDSLHIAADGERLLYTTLTFGGRRGFLADRTGATVRAIQLDGTGLALSVGWWQVD